MSTLNVNSHAERSTAIIDLHRAGDVTRVGGADITQPYRSWIIRFKKEAVVLLHCSRVCCKTNLLGICYHTLVCSLWAGCSNIDSKYDCRSSQLRPNRSPFERCTVIQNCNPEANPFLIFLPLLVGFNNKLWLLPQCRSMCKSPQKIPTDTQHAI